RHGRQAQPRPTYHSGPREPPADGALNERTVAMADEWGPLGPLAGDWQGEGGLDSVFSHALEQVLATPYLEKLSFKPFGPVQNGRQALYGLDYKSAMWRGDEENPFHT